MKQLVARNDMNMEAGESTVLGVVIQQIQAKMKQIEKTLVGV
jgi:hypothetical protein